MQQFLQILLFTLCVVLFYFNQLNTNCIFSDNHDELFDDDGPPNKFKEFSDDFRDEEYTEVERTHTTRTEKITRGAVCLGYYTQKQFDL